MTLTFVLGFGCQRSVKVTFKVQEHDGGRDQGAAAHPVTATTSPTARAD